MKGTLKLTPFRISNGAMAAKDLPSRLKLLNWGRNETVSGPVFLNDQSIAQFSSLQKQLGFDRVALDFEHNTVPGSPEFERTREPREVAAFGVPMLIAGDGLYLDQLQWTPSGTANARNYVDLSPAPKLTAAREVVFLHSAALCRQGQVEDLTFFSVPMDAAGDMSSVLEPATAEEETAIMDKILALLRKALGLADTATEADIVTGIEAMNAAAKRVTEIDAAIAPLAALIGEKGQITTLSAGIETLRTDITALKGVDAAALKTQVTALQGAMEKIEKDLVCYHARLEGKVIPLSAEAIAAQPIAALRELVDGLNPGEVPIFPLSVGAKDHHVDGSDVVSDTDKKVAVACGLDPEKIGKK